MFTRPVDLSDREVWRAVERGWNITVDHLEYAPVGFGSHHWDVAGQGSRWFVTVDDLDARLVDGSDLRTAAHSRLVAALSTVRALVDAGAGYAVGPLRSVSHSVVEAITDRYVVAVYPHVDGRVGDFAEGYRDSADRLQVVDLLAQLHQAETTAASARVDDLVIPRRRELINALTELDAPWTSGPFAERSRLLLAQNSEALERLFSYFDGLVRQLAKAPSDCLTLTHGEPHAGNVIFAAGGPVLIDWDTMLIARPERDLWALFDQDDEVRSRYENHTGRQIDDTALDAYRLWWDLCEIALFTYEFRRPHRNTDDMETAWAGFVTHLDPARWTNAR